MASGHVGCVSNAAKAGLLLLAVSALRAQTGNVQSTDPELFPGRWTPVILTEGQGGAAELRWELLDGNPQSSGNVRTFVNGSPSAAATSSVYAFFFRAGASFSPRERAAAIASLAYSEDLRYLGTGSSGVESTAPALRQNGRLYAAGGLANSIPSTWTTLRLSGLAASSFVEYSVANGHVRVDAASHPDFSGGAIQFGFLRARSNPSSTPETHELGIDNWSFTLTTSASPVIAAPDSYQTVEDTALVVPAPGVLANDVNNGLRQACSPLESTWKTSWFRTGPRRNSAKGMTSTMETGNNPASSTPLTPAQGHPGGKQRPDEAPGRRAQEGQGK